MSFLLKRSKKTGFVLLLPIIMTSLFALTSSYILLYKIDHLAYALGRHESYLKKKYDDLSTKNLNALYQSFDPHSASIP